MFKEQQELVAILRAGAVKLDAEDATRRLFGFVELGSYGNTIHDPRIPKVVVDEYGEIVAPPLVVDFYRFVKTGEPSRFFVSSAPGTDKGSK